MRTVKDIPARDMLNISSLNITRNEIVNEIVGLQDDLINRDNKDKKDYLNGKLDALLSLYTFINDVEHEKQVIGILDPA